MLIILHIIHTSILQIIQIFKRILNYIKEYFAVRTFTVKEFAILRHISEDSPELIQIDENDQVDILLQYTSFLLLHQSEILVNNYSMKQNKNALM